MVFCGLILVNFFHLKIFPKIYPPISELMHRAITKQRRNIDSSLESLRQEIEKRDKINIKDKNNIIFIFLNTDNNSYIPAKKIKIKKNDKK